MRSAAFLLLLLLSGWTSRADTPRLNILIERMRTNCAQASFEPTTVTRTNYLEAITRMTGEKDFATGRLKELAAIATNGFGGLREESAWQILLEEPPIPTVLTRSIFGGSNAAAFCAMFEALAKKKFNDRRTTEAGIYKRAAHLWAQSLPASDRNNVELACLASAALEANDIIPETAAPCEVGGYVFRSRSSRQDILANAGGFAVNVRSLSKQLAIAVPVNDTWGRLSDIPVASQIYHVGVEEPAHVAFSVRDYKGEQGIIEVRSDYDLTARRLTVKTTIDGDVSHFRLLLGAAGAASLTNRLTIIAPPNVQFRTSTMAETALEADVIGKTITFAIVRD